MIGRTKLLFVNQYSNGCEILRPVFNLTGKAENEGGSVEFAARIIAAFDTRGPYPRNRTFAK